MPASPRAVLRVIARIVRLPGHLTITTLDRLKARNGVGPLNRFQRGAVHGFVWLCALIVFSMVTTPTPRSSATAGIDYAPTRAPATASA